MKKLWLFPFLILVGLGAIWLFAGTPTIQQEGPLPESVVDLPIVPLEEAYPHVMVPRTTLFEMLRKLEVQPLTIQHIVTAAKPIQNLANLKPGIRFQIWKSPENPTDLEKIEFHFSAIERLEVIKINNGWSARKIMEDVDIRVVSFHGVVNSSLWESAVGANMDPDLISELADIFGWEVDFAREVRVNDRWRIIVEQKTVKGQAVGWGAILAAEYENAGELHQAALYRTNGKEMGYYTLKGESLRKMFLKSPIRYGRITSGFKKRRFHPVLQIFRAHLGVDYGAPIGTPVRSVGDGVVTFAQRSGGGGNVIKVRHNSTYETAYKHLNGYARGVRSGTRVQQGQVIGYVGNTGLSTGPHLHFEFYQHGRYIDPLSKRFPTSDPIAKELLTGFQNEASQLLAKLPQWPSESTETTSAAKP